MQRGKYYYFLLFFVFSPMLLLAQSWKKEVAKMTLSKQPFFYYKHIHKNNGILPVTGEQLHIQYTISTYGKKAKLLLSSYEQSEPILVQLPAQRFDNYFTAPLRYMSVGDSLKVIIPFDSISNSVGEIAQFFKKKDAVVFTYKLVNIVSIQELQILEEKAQKRADSIRDFVKEQISFLEKGDSALAYISTEQGLKYKIFDAGNTEKKANTAKSVQVHYLCYDINGNLLDDSYLSKQPIQITQQQNQYIKGIELVIRLLAEQATAIAIIPPHLAYGEAGIQGIIPPNATLVFWLEILDVTL